ncbi:MAG TPA: carboxypeptidase-like regulatory domain-containing protein [Terriglobales bacterium]|nr:carboxypeptidase-like regulatory domain-containing protein [Terriglobales bacterium]
MKKLSVALAMLFALAIALGIPRLARAQDDEDEGPMSNMRFVVVRDANGKPVKNAAVVLHSVTKKGKQAMGGLELKTDEEGKTWIDGIPYGVLRVQVLAPGFQTFGEDYEIKLPETQITVRLKRPASQYSVYGAADKAKAKDKTTDPQPPAQKQPDQKPPQ